MTTSTSPQITGAGVGLRLPYLAEVAAAPVAAAWLEIHPENFLANPHALELLLAVAGRHPVSVHTVGVSIGSTAGVDRRHLDRVRGLIDRIDPVLVSGHLAWSTHEGIYLNDLLPLPYTEETLDLLARHLAEVQAALGRPYLVENPSSYVALAGSTMDEPAFLTALVERTGCRLLCDVSNIYLSGHNMGFDPYAYIDRLPANAVGELHLGGFTIEADEAGDAGAPGASVLIDTHSTRIAEPVWELYAHALRHFGAQPTLIEWDNDLPPFATLLAEAERADRVLADTRTPEACHALAG
jgi:uncharacterized protein (UPF0276 family)